jgi:ferredoxin
MLYRVIDCSDLPNLIEHFLRDYEVIAPVKQGKSWAFVPISSFDEIELNYPQTLTSLKKYYIPPTETLLTFDAETNSVTDFEHDIKPRVLFGAHACDINALNNLELALGASSSKYVDPYYEARKASTMIVGLSCSPSETCFCNMVDSDEVRSGYDLFLQDIGGRYLVSIGSVEAANILEAACDLREATDEDRRAFRQRTRMRQTAFSEDIPNIQEVPMLMDAFHSDEFWDELGSRCLSCTACSSVCPTCYCFDIVDVLDPDGKTGRRERRWDACTSPQFAEVAGGHNFRATTRERVRHRMYHKLNGFNSKYGRYLCVGCGRCVRACKADISPIEVLRFFERQGAEDAE